MLIDILHNTCDIELPASWPQTALRKGRSFRGSCRGRIGLILAALDAAQTAKGLDIHTFHLHPLKGDLKGFRAVTVRANWRIIFRFVNRNACDVDLVDYH